MTNQRKRVLVVDDSTLITTLLRLYLERDHDVVVVNADFERLLDPTDLCWAGIDTLLVDLRMPGVSGVEILRVAARFFPAVHRVLLSGATGGYELDLARSLAHETLDKQNEIADVLRQIEAL